MTTTKTRRARRQFTDEYRASVVKLVLDEGKSVHQVAADLDLTESALRLWVEKAKAARGGSGAMTTYGLILLGWAAAVAVSVRKLRRGAVTIDLGHHGVTDADTAEVPTGSAATVSVG